MDDHDNDIIDKDALINALIRLQAINWDERSNETDDLWLVELFRAFRSNVAQWTDYLRLERIHIFTNLALYTDPTLTLPDPVEVWLEEVVRNRRLFWGGRTVLRSYLCWVHLKSQGKINEKEVELPEPYEPLIQFWEMGGYFRPDHDGSVEVCSVPGSLHGIVGTAIKKRKQSPNSPRNTYRNT